MKTAKQKNATRKTDNADIYIGKMIRVTRVIKNISQEKLSEKIGVTFQQLQKYENATNRVSCSRLIKIAAALDVSVMDFFPEGVT